MPPSDCCYWRKRMDIGASAPSAQQRPLSLGRGSEPRSPPPPPRWIRPWLGGLSQIPFFTPTLLCCLLVRSKSEGERGLLVYQVLTCRLIDPNTRFWSRMHSRGQLGRRCFQKKTPSPERRGEGGGKTISGVRPPPGDRASPSFGLSLSTSRRLSGIN